MNIRFEQISETRYVAVLGESFGLPVRVGKTEKDNYCGTVDFKTVRITTDGRSLAELKSRMREAIELALQDEDIERLKMPLRREKSKSKH